MTHEEFVVNRSGSLASSGSDGAGTSVGEVSAGQSHLDEPYEIYLNDAGEKCVRIGSFGPGMMYFMPFDEWLVLSERYGLSLGDDGLAKRVHDIYSSLPTVDELLFAKWEDDLV